MFCEKCGNRLREGSMFCNNCGMSVEDSVYKPADQKPAADVQYAAASVQTQTSVVEEKSPAENPKPDNRKTNKGKIKIPVIIVLAVLILFVGVCSACRFIPGITNIILPRTTNFMMKNFSSPNRYLKFVATEQGGGNTIGEIVSDSAEVLKNLNVTGNSVEGNVKLTAGSGLKDIIKKQTGDMANPYIDWIDSVGISYDGGTNGNLAGYKIGLSVNDANVLSLDSVLDFENKAVYATFPELSSTPIKTTLGNELEDLENVQTIPQVQDLIKTVVEEITVDRLVNKYVAHIIDAVDDVEKGSEKVTAGEVSQKYTVISVDIDEADVINALKAVLNEARDDKELKRVIDIIYKSKVEGGNSDEFYDQFVKGIDVMIEQLNNKTVTSGEQHITLNFWANSKGELVGTGVKMDNATVKCLSVEKGNKFGIRTSVGVGSQNILFEGGGKISGNKKSGNFNLSVMGTDIVTVKSENLEVKGGKDGGFSGKITIQPVEEIADVLAMVGAEDAQEILSGSRIELIGESNTAELAVYTNEQLFASIQMSGNQKQGEKPEIVVPSNFVDAKDENAMSSWAAGLALNAVTDKFREAGAPELLLTLIEMSVAKETEAEPATEEVALAEEGATVDVAEEVLSAAQEGEVVLPAVELEVPDIQ